MRSPCSSCDARCCRNFFAGVTPGDVARIASETSLSPSAFLQLQPAESVRADWAPPVWGDGKEFRLGLARSEQGCVFLSGGRCAIYNSRPLVCRTYPHVLDGDRIVSDRLCPKMEDWARKGHAGQVAFVKKYQRELTAMRRVLSWWNWCRGMGGSLKELVDYMTAAAREQAEISFAIARVRSLQ